MSAVSGFQGFATTRVATEASQNRHVRVWVCASNGHATPRGVVGGLQVGVGGEARWVCSSTACAPQQRAKSLALVEKRADIAPTIVNPCRKACHGTGNGVNVFDPRFKDPAETSLHRGARLVLLNAAGSGAILTVFMMDWVEKDPACAQASRHKEQAS